ncbi:MAG: hypothetical protein E7503_05025 [Ruminococcus sp.]|nr:hypothetical protein [Ruminococcus sp.]
MGWTDQQEAAILARGASLVVSAAAGSGKTSVLVERLIQLLADEMHPTPAERVVVVTFTNDAAAEVRQRLDMALSAKLEDSAGNVWLRRQQTMLQSAKISTIHSFCFDLLREHFSLLDIAPGFRIIEDAEEGGLRTDCMSAAIEQLYGAALAGDAQAAEDRALLLGAFCDKNDQDLDRMLLSVYRDVESIPFGLTLLAQAAQQMEQGDLPQKAFGFIREELEGIIRMYRAAIHAADTLENEKLDALLSTELQYALDALCALNREDAAALADCLYHLPFSRMVTVRKKGPGIDEAKAVVTTMRSTAMQHLKDLEHWALPLRFAREDLPRHGALLMAMYRLLLRFDALLWEEKCARSVVGFADAMKLTLKLLANRNEDGSLSKTPLAQQLSEQYDILMIDEFQDADNQQDLIFRMLSRNGSAERYGDNLFVVGDSKQCIYRFRAANPANFMRAMEESAAYVGPMLEQNTCIYLNRNFRSAQEVIDCVNHVFGMLMTKEVGEIRYTKEEALEMGAEYAPAERPVELLMLPTNGRQSFEEEAVAKRIRQHLEQGTPVQQRDGSMRPCTPKDFLILLRTNTRMGRFADALTAEHIPVCAVESGGYLQSPEITLLLELLRSVDNPLLDVPMAAAMLSPMMGFTTDDLILIRLADRKGSLFGGLRKITETPQSYDADFVKRCSDYLAFLESMRLYSAVETPEQLIRRLYHHTDFLGMMQLAGDGAKKKANLRALLGYARQFESNRGGGLSAFLRYLDAILQRKSDLDGGGVLAGTGDVVSIKTIHKSKGLEAPFVILAHSETSFTNRNDLAPPYRYHSDLGFGFRLRDPQQYTIGQTLPYEVIAAQNHQESLSEEMRLLYVALTRAREHLILPICYGKSVMERAASYAVMQETFGGQSNMLTGFANSMRDWLLMALIRHPSCDALRKALGIACSADTSMQPLGIGIIDGEAVLADTKQEEEAQAIGCNAELLEKMQVHCAWRYTSATAGLTAKYGVSELVKKEDFSMPLRRPAFTRNVHGLTGAERGTALHTFMEYADFSKAAADMQGEIAALEQRGKLTAQQAKAVAASDLHEFFNSPLYARIAASPQVLREQKFTVRIADLQLGESMQEIAAQYAGTPGLLIGIMDLVFAEGEGYVLVDYKTDRNVTAQILQERYSEQLRLYAAALELLTGKPVTECCLYSLSLGCAVPIER